MLKPQFHKLKLNNKTSPTRKMVTNSWNKTETQKKKTAPDLDIGEEDGRLEENGRAESGRNGEMQGPRDREFSRRHRLVPCSRDFRNPSSTPARLLCRCIITPRTKSIKLKLRKWGIRFQSLVCDLARCRQWIIKHWRRERQAECDGEIEKRWILILRVKDKGIIGISGSQWGSIHWF